jgi:hypothetical protein
MVGVIAVGLVIGGLATVVLRRRRALARGRQARARERIAAIVLCEEFKAAIDSIEMALQDSNAKWLVSMSESTTLTEAWREQAEALQGLATEHWRVVSDAVDAVSPRYGLPSARPPVEDLRRSLANAASCSCKAPRSFVASATSARETRRCTTGNAATCSSDRPLLPSFRRLA